MRAIVSVLLSAENGTIARIGLVGAAGRAVCDPDHLAGLSRAACKALLLCGQTALEGIHETSPPTFSASGRGRCRIAGGVADRAGAGVSDPAGAHHRRLYRRRRV